MGDAAIIIGIIAQVIAVVFIGWKVVYAIGKRDAQFDIALHEIAALRSETKELQQVQIEQGQQISSLITSIKIIENKIFKENAA